MPIIKLPHYLRTHRKRFGFSQSDVAFLLGTQSRSHISRYENYTRLPGLETALAYEVIFQAPMREMFAGIYERVEKQVQARAVLRGDLVSQARMTPRNQYRQERIADIARLNDQGI
ncbi:helix-turn-helix transcriptional regulator [bacterium]|nr:helix-turn-helix transcriptional regulator [bacterium]